MFVIAAVVLAHALACEHWVVWQNSPRVACVSSANVEDYQLHFVSVVHMLFLGICFCMYYIMNLLLFCVLWVLCAGRVERELSVRLFVYSSI